jgi:DNA-binding HxlR family transcriptional regulator
VESTSDVFNAACPSRAALELIAGKWALLVIPALAPGPLRNGELLRRVGGISQKMLTQTLKELQRNGLVVRTEHGTVPPHVSYRLTPMGRSLSKALIALDRWAETHHGALAAARERFAGDA